MIIEYENPSSHKERLKKIFQKFNCGNCEARCLFEIVIICLRKTIKMNKIS